MSNKNESSITTETALSPQEQIDRLTQLYEKLAVDVHTVKGNLAANTAITQGMATAQDALQAQLAKVNVDKLVVLVDALDSMRGGIKVLGWLERPAKWLTVVATAAGVIYSLWSRK